MSLDMLETLVDLRQSSRLDHYEAVRVATKIVLADAARVGREIVGVPLRPVVIGRFTALPPPAVTQRNPDHHELAGQARRRVEECASVILWQVLNDVAEEDDVVRLL